MVSKVDQTVDYGFKSWPYCRLWFQKLAELLTVEISKKKSQLLQLGRLSIFRGFCCGFSIGFQWENGRIRTKWPQNLQKFPSKSTLDYVADPRSCNSWLFSRKVTILSTMVSKVDHTVDYGFKSWPYCRLWFQKLTILSTSQKKIQPSTVDFLKKNPATVDLSSKVDCRLQCLVHHMHAITAQQLGLIRVSMATIKKKVKKKYIYI
jgi:hypothetical protein